MNLSVGQKYGAVALRPFEVKDLPEETEVLQGVYVLRELPFGIPEHWKEWIGSLQVDRLTECDLFVVAVGPSETPDILDQENQKLERCAQGVYWGLVFADFFRCTGEPITLTGANREGKVDARSLGRLRPPVATAGRPLPALSPASLASAAGFAGALQDLFKDEYQARIRRAVHAFYRGIAEREVQETLHQFLRAIEAFVHAERGKTLSRLRSRTELFIGPGRHELVTEWFEARSAIEHLNDLDQLYTGDLRNRRISLLRNAVEVEAVARYCLARFFKNRELWGWFRSETEIEEFWKLEPDVRRQLWGDPLNIEEIQASFQHEYLDDDDLGLTE